MALCVSVIAIGITIALGLMLLCWLVRDEMRERRKAREIAELGRKFRKITVAELVERVEGERRVRRTATRRDPK
jgi:hypothetical protein